MSVYLQDADVTIHQGDVLDELRNMPDSSVHMCCTSPPFYGLRDYGTGTWEGGDPGCDHRSPTMQEGRNENRAKLAGSAATNSAQLLLAHGSACGKCGAVKVDQQIGLEPTPDEYVARLVEVFREVRRVLRDDGTLWVEVGDSYNSPGSSGYAYGDLGGLAGASSAQYQATMAAGAGTKAKKNIRGMKQKDLIGAPWLLAFALRADGWYLRSEIIWAKPNPMPESVTDRPTTSHSRVFLLAKQPRYFYDAEAIREPYGDNTHSEDRTGGHYAPPGQPPHSSNGARNLATGRNRRSVWTIPTQPYPEAHFATWPEALCRDMILAGTSDRGVCPECGAPWERIMEKGDLRPVRGDYIGPLEGDYKKDGSAAVQYNGGKAMVRTTEGWSLLKREMIDKGWQPACDCAHRGSTSEGDGPGPEDASGSARVSDNPPAPVPATALDPFGGSGTTAHVARKLGRKAVLIELNPDYCALAARRLQQQSLFA